MATSRYVTLIGVRHAGVDFPPGTPMALSDELAAPLLAVKAIQAQAGALPAMPAVKGGAVTSAIDSATGLPVDEYLKISRSSSGGVGNLKVGDVVITRPEQLFDGSADGYVTWSGKNMQGVTFSAGARAPTTKAITDAGVRVVSATRTDATNDYYDMVLPDLYAARIMPRNMAIVAYSPDWSAVAEIGYYAATTGFAKFAQARWVSTNGTANAGSALAGSGWRTLFKGSDEYTLSGAPDFAVDQFISHKLRVTQQAGRSSDITFAVVRVDDKDVSTISIVSDDGYLSWHNESMPLLAARGLKASVAVIADRVGYSGTFVTWDQLRAWVAAGHTCVTHGVRNGLNSLLNYATIPEMVADVTWNRDQIRANGCDVDGSADFYVFPQGEYYTGGNLQDRSLTDALLAAGFKAGRSTILPQAFNTRHQANIAQRMIIPVIGHLWSATDEAANINAIIAKIDSCAKYGMSAAIVFHQVVASPSTGIQISPANLALILDRIAYWVAQGKMRNVTIDKQLR